MAYYQLDNFLKELEYNPKYQVVNKKDYKENQYIRELFPAVVKYCGSNGSKDVYYCENMNAYLKNCDKLFADFPNGELLVEEYLNGDQFIVEVLVKDRKVHIAALVEQEIQYLNEHFIITGYNLIINYARSYFEKLKRAVISIISRLGLENGPCHLEMRHVNNEWKLVEINPRISGAGMNKLLSIGFGFNLVEETLKLALKEKFNISPRFTKNSFAEYVILEDKGILQRITGRAEVINSPGIEYTYVKPRRGTLLSPPTSLGNRYAYVIATGKSEEEAKENAKLAAKKIVFHIHKEP
jgi:biotin carboxylase